MCIEKPFTPIKSILVKTKNNNVELRGDDKYVVLSTCREEDETIRANLYLRQIPDKEMDNFLAKHKDELKYVAKR